MMNAVASRPAPCAKPKPEARALVGNTSEAKICIELPASWMKKIMQKPTASSMVSLVALTNATANAPARTNDTIDVGFRPKRSSAYIMQRLAQGNASVMPNV